MQKKLVHLIASCALALSTACAKAEMLPDPARDEALAAGPARVLVIAGGCFWGVEAVFRHVRGVTRAVSGYAGGTAATAQYETVGGGDTGHAEAVEITYDPAVVSLGTLLKVFFAVAHDPTELNRQGPDRGTQYRSAVFFATPGQEDIARAYIAQLDAAKIFPSSIATALEPLDAFYPAEAYHQDYLRQHPEQPYIVVNDIPKVARLKALYPALYVD